MMMTLTSDLRSLWCALHDLRDAVLPLRLLVVEDRPEKIAPQPVQAFADSLDDVFGQLQEAIDSISPGARRRTKPRRSEPVVDRARSVQQRCSSSAGSGPTRSARTTA